MPPYLCKNRTCAAWIGQSLPARADEMSTIRCTERPTMAQLQSVDGLLEQGVLALYRRWPHLPHRTTLPWIDQLRATLAAELDALSRPRPGTFSVEPWLILPWPLCVCR